MSAPKPPANFEYYKLGKIRGQSSQPRTMCIVIGLALQLVAALLWGPSTDHTGGAAFVFGVIIATAGALLVFVGLVAVGVRMGTDELLQAARQSLRDDQP